MQRRWRSRPTSVLLFVANAASDNLTIIDTATDEPIETVWTKAKPSDLCGAAPNGACLRPIGPAAVRRQRKPERDRRHAVGARGAGRDPAVGADPGRLVSGGDRRRRRSRTALCGEHQGVADGTQSAARRSEARGFNSHHYHGSVSLSPIVDGEPLAALVRTGGEESSARRDRAPRLPPRGNARPRPMPERIGEPSTIEHVVYIIKENRTYDQVLGRRPAGTARPIVHFRRSDHAQPAQAGRTNSCCSTTPTVPAFSAPMDISGARRRSSTDYMEKALLAFRAAIPTAWKTDDIDALAYSPAGFIWDNAVLPTSRSAIMASSRSPRSAGKIRSEKVRRVSSTTTRLRRTKPT